MIKTLVLLHVISGSGAVLGMLGALTTKKGGLWHRRSGRLYTYSMVVALLLALLVSALTANLFLFLIGLFSGYFVHTGWRAAVARDGIRTAIDQHLTQLMVAVVLAMIGYGIYLTIVGNSIGIALCVFGVFAAVPAWEDMKSGVEWPRGKERIVLHLNRMGGASIATVTAVFVVNIQTNPAFIAWLLPAAIGTPLIMYWTKKTLTGGVKTQRTGN